MPRQPAKQKHIEHTPSGYRANIRIRGVLHRKRFGKHVEPVKVKQWLVKTELRYRRGTLAPTGLFSEDAEKYLESVRGMPTFAQREQHIREWMAVFGDSQRDHLTSADIAAQLHRWRTEPRTLTRRGGKIVTYILSAAAVNKRRSALMHLYTVLDGRGERNPVKESPKFQEPAPAPKAIPYDVIERIFKAMPPSRSRARLMVLAYTGIPHAEIARLEPTDVDLKAGTVAVHGRRKGKGTAGRIVPLNADGLKAFKAMDREDAWGSFSRATLRVVFQRACTKAGLAGEDFTPYDLRHSFGTEMYRASGDIRATQVLMGHSTEALTHRYTVAATDPRVAQAVKQWRKKAPR